MMRSRLARALSLVIGVPLLGALPGAPTATAATTATTGTACVATYVGPGFSVGPDNPFNPAEQTDAPAYGGTTLPTPIQDTRLITDVDFTLDISTRIPAGQAPNKQGLDVYLYRGVIGPDQSQAFVSEQVRGGVIGSYTFDDEAGTTKLPAIDPAPGRYLPHTPLSKLEVDASGAPRPAAGVWAVWINNHSEFNQVEVRSWSVTITYADCDSDGDGTNDSVDNCPITPNPDQSDIDGDGRGDTCDDDVDGDGIPNDIDACRTTAGTSDGCPAAARTARLRLTHKNNPRKARLVIRVRSTLPVCQARTQVQLRRIKRGKARTIKTFRTTTTGNKRLKPPRRKGRYLIQVNANHISGKADCGQARSKRIRIRG